MNVEQSDRCTGNLRKKEIGPNHVLLSGFTKAFFFLANAIFIGFIIPKREQNGHIL